jgi:DNA-binding CsgD family transcriptional regulator
MKPISNPAALDIASFGIIVATSTGRITWFNAVAEEFLSRGDGLISRYETISSNDHTTALMLADRIRQVTQPQSSRKSAPEQALRVARATGSPLMVLVAPLAHPANDSETCELSAILLITDPEHRPGILGRHLVDWFGLTPAEADLAVQLANGARLEDLTTLKRVRISTLRSQLRAVLDKTGAERQADLVGLLHRLPTFRPRRAAWPQHSGR